MAVNSNALLRYEQLEELITLIYGDIKGKATSAHTHSATDITETTTKRFVTDIEKAAWNAKISQDQLDQALNTLVSGLTWKGSFATLKEIQALENPQDGWFAIATEGTNTFYVYESETNEWQSLGGIMLPGVATETSNGLMTAEMVKKLASLSNYTLPVATTDTLGGVKSGSIIYVSSDGTLQIDTSKVITDAERTKWNTAATEASSALSKANSNATSITSLTTRMSTAESTISTQGTKIGTLETTATSHAAKITAVENRATELEGKVVYISSTDIASLVANAKA
jgi:hypothetical protein